MALRAYRNRRDANEQAIFTALKGLGAQVYPLNKPCDALICFKGRVRLIEVKTLKGKLTPSQTLFASIWPMHIIRSPEEAIDFILKLSQAAHDS